MRAVTGEFTIPNTADTYARRRIGIEQYRSRAAIPEEVIWSALAINFLRDDRYSTTVRVVAGETDQAFVANVIADAVTSANNIKYVNCTRSAWAEKELNERLNEHVDFTLIGECHSNPAARVKIYTNTINSMVIVANTMSQSLWFDVAATIYSYYSDDAELINAWRTGNGETINTLLKNRHKEDVKQRIKEQLEKVHDAIISNLEKRRENDPRIEEIKQMRRYIADYEQQIMNYLDRIREKEREIVYETARINTDSVDTMMSIMESMLNRGILTNVELSSTRLMEFTITTQLKYTNEEDLEAIKRASVRNWYGNQPGWMQELIDKIFKREVKLIITNPVLWDFESGNIRLARGTIGSEEYQNPHHRHYNCWGDYGPKIRTASEEGKFEEAVSYIVAATAGINILDAAVMGRMCVDFTGTYLDSLILIDEEGNLISPRMYKRKWVLKHE